MIKVIMLFLLLGTASCVSNTSNNVFSQVDPAGFQKMIVEKGSDIQLIDVRTSQEFIGGHIEGALNIDYNNPSFKSEISKLDKEKPVLVYCLSGGRSGASVGVFEELGFKNITELDGGMMSWRSAGLPEVSGSAKPKLGTSQLKVTLKDNPLVLIDFYADWCAPCKKMKPTLDEIDGEGVIKVARVNADIDQSEVINYKIENLPTLILAKNGKEVWRGVGLHSKEQLEEVITKFK
jgi:thioredoxin 1